MPCHSRDRLTSETKNDAINLNTQEAEASLVPVSSECTIPPLLKEDGYLIGNLRILFLNLTCLKYPANIPAS